MSNPETRVFVSGPGFTTRLAIAQLLAVNGWSLVPLVVVYAVLGYMLLSSGDWWPLGFRIVLFLLVLVVVGGGLVYLTRRQVNRTSPDGSLHSVTLGENSMILTVGSVSSEVPYSTYSRVRRRGGFVLLRIRSTRQLAILPAALFPGGDFDRLVAAVANPAAAPATTAFSGSTAAAYDREYVTDAGFTARLARSATLRLFTRGPLVVILAIVTAIGLLLLLVGALGLLLAATGNASIDEAWPVLIGAACVLGFAVLQVVGVSLLLRTQLRRMIPVGSVYGMSLDAEALRLRGPDSSSVLPYAGYRRARTRGRFVEVVGQRGIARLTLPVELFPEGELDRLNGLLAAAPKS